MASVSEKAALDHQPNAIFVEAHLAQGINIENNLPPYHNEGRFRYAECDRCCTCTPDCWLAWLFSCFTLGQISEKLSNTGRSFCLNYNGIVAIFLILLVLDCIFGVAFGSVGTPLRFTGIFLFVVACQLRGLVRQLYSIPGSCCDDCCRSFFCQPCVITQLVGQLWLEPSKTPGCSISSEPGSLA